MKHSIGLNVLSLTVFLKRDVSHLELRLLSYMYTIQTLEARWGSTMSSQFIACNGVEQGPIMYPVIFSIYMDGVFAQLQRSCVGRHMGNHSTGCMSYADDNTLLKPTRSELEVLIAICDKYAEKDCVHDKSDE